PPDPLPAGPGVAPLAAGLVLMRPLPPVALVDAEGVTPAGASVEVGEAVVVASAWLAGDSGRRWGAPVGNAATGRPAGRNKDEGERCHGAGRRADPPHGAVQTANAVVAVPAGDPWPPAS